MTIEDQTIVDALRGMSQIGKRRSFQPPDTASRWPSAAHTRIPEAQPMDEAPPGNIRSGVAQLVEQPPVKRPVVGSSPTPGAIDEFIVRAERHAYRWTEENRPLPIV